MELKKFAWLLLTVTIVMVLVGIGAEGCPHRILVDTDVDTDDLLAFLYLLKQNRSEFDLQAVTISANAWSNAAAAVHHIYDILHMMNRDDISVGVGGEGGILDDGKIQPNVGGYLPLIEQGMSTAGGCRYRQVIPVGLGGRLNVDTNFGFRRSLLPQGTRKYSPLRQPTAQEVLIQKVAEGPISIFIIGAHTNIAIFLMNNPHLKKNIEHFYIMGGGVRSKNPGNLFTDDTSNPYAEFNFFADPFAAYQVIHSGIPITLVPLDATNTIPITKEFFEEFEMNRHTYEAKYSFKSLERVRDTLSDDQFYTSFFMWDSFAAGVAVSIMHNSNNNHNGENEFADMEYMNITVITSNEPFEISDGSNPFFDNRKVPIFNLTRNGVHSGHVQTGLRDPFCRGPNGKGICKDGYTEEKTGPESVRVRVATKAKPNSEVNSKLDREFYKSFLEVLNRPLYSGMFDFTTQFAHYAEVLYKPDFTNRKLGRPIVFDMDMSAGDFLALFYLLKVPVEEMNLKAILVSPTGWANGATMDVIYDLLHMMGRDDIPVGLGDAYAMNQSDPTFSIAGDCKYSKSIPNGSGGFLDSDTLYGLARNLPRCPRRYTAQKAAKFGAQDTQQAELKQPLALEVWNTVLETLDPESKITILTNGPLTTLAKIVLSGKNSTSSIQDVYIVGGHIRNNRSEKGNVFTIPSNEYAEFNMFLDPFAAKTVFESGLDIKLIPLSIQRRVSSFPELIKNLRLTKKTPESLFSHRLLSRLFRLQQNHHRYKHMETFVGEILGAVVLAGDSSNLNPVFTTMPIEVSATGDETEDGQLSIDETRGKLVMVLEDVDIMVYYKVFTDRLGDKQQSAVIGSFDEQRRRWSSPPNVTVII